MLLSICIPTRDRAQTLEHSLSTCLAIESDDIEIIISDNFSSDNTADLCSKINDHRVRVIRTNQRLSMSANYENVIRAATGDFITIIGDDDAVLHDIVDTLKQAISNHPGYQAFHMPFATYTWPVLDPTFAENHRANVLSIPIHNRELSIQSAAALQRIAQSRISYTDLPRPYYSIISRELVLSIESDHRLIRSRIPDVYLAMACTASVQQFISITRPIAIAGCSKFSTGARYIGGGYLSKTRNRVADQFADESLLPEHPRVKMGAGIALALCNLECLFQAMDAGLIKQKLQVDFQNAAERALALVPATNQDLNTAVVDALRGTFALNDIDPGWIDALQTKPLSGYETLFPPSHTIVIDGSEAGLNNVADAARRTSEELDKLHTILEPTNNRSPIAENSPESKLLSYHSQNFEDVLLDRCFGKQTSGFYIDVGAQEESFCSVTKHFYEAGWSGLNVEPNPFFFSRLETRLRDLNVCFGASNCEDELVFYQFDNGLSTLSANNSALASERGFTASETKIAVMPLNSILKNAGYNEMAFEFLKVDVEGHELEALQGLDLSRYRPKVILCEVTIPDSTEKTDFYPALNLYLSENGYEHAFFDGLNSWWIEDAHIAELKPHFDYPVGIFDWYSPALMRQKIIEFNDLQLEVDRLLPLSTLRGQARRLVRAARWRLGAVIPSTWAK
jgi:FkbM family methyltransferase